MTGWTIAGAEFTWTGDKQWGAMIILCVVPLAVYFTILISLYSLIFAFNPAYNLGYNALIYSEFILIIPGLRAHCICIAYLVEIFPFSSRARGLSVFLWWSKTTSFFNSLLNPIGIAKAGWKYYIR